MAQLFNNWDEDKDGTLDKEEWRKGILKLGFDAPIPAINDMFERFDVNNDGHLQVRGGLPTSYLLP